VGWSPRSSRSGPCPRKRKMAGGLWLVAPPHIQSPSRCTRRELKSSHDSITKGNSTGSNPKGGRVIALREAAQPRMVGGGGRQAVQEGRGVGGNVQREQVIADLPPPRSLRWQRPSPFTTRRRPPTPREPPWQSESSSGGGRGGCPPGVMRGGMQGSHRANQVPPYESWRPWSAAAGGR